MDQESGNFGLFLNNRSKEKLFVIASFHIVNKNGETTNLRHMKHMFNALSKGWGWKDFIMKDELDNKMEDLLDQNGRLTIHLKLSGKDKVMKISAILLQCTEVERTYRND